MNHNNHNKFILAVVCVGTFMGTLDGSIVNVVNPIIQKDFNVNLTQIQWVITAYLLAISSLLPVFGRLADMIGRKKVYSAGFLVFITGSALCGVAPGLWFLVVSRILQAVGASMFMANGSAIVTAVFPRTERGKALGIIGTVVALGGLFGPGTGGLLMFLSSWRFIFYVNVPIGIIGFIAAMYILPNDKPHAAGENFDLIGAVFFSAGIVSLLYAVNNSVYSGWDSPVIVGGLILGVVGLVSFVIRELHVKHPLIDLSLFKIQPFTIGNFTGWLIFTAMFANNFFFPFYLQDIQGYSAVIAGLFLMVTPFIMFFVAPFSGHLSDKIGPKLLTTGGLVICGTGLLTFSFLTANSPITAFIPGLILIGLGSGMFQSPNNSSIMGSVPVAKLGTSGAVNSLVRNIGMITGISFAVLLFNSLGGVERPTPAQTASFMSPYHAVMIVAAVICYGAALISLSRKTYINENKPKPATV